MSSLNCLDLYCLLLCYDLNELKFSGRGFFSPHFCSPHMVCAQILPASSMRQNPRTEPLQIRNMALYFLLYGEMIYINDLISLKS